MANLFLILYSWNVKKSDLTRYNIVVHTIKLKLTYMEYSNNDTYSFFLITSYWAYTATEEVQYRVFDNSSSKNSENE
jgi:hypothetical protein